MFFSNTYRRNLSQSSSDKTTWILWAYCDIESRIEYGSYCPLTCSVVKHGVLPDSISLEQSIKFSKPNRETGEIKVSWDSVGGIQSKRTTQLRSENYFYGRIDSQILQQNLAKLDVAYTGFFKYQRGFPAFRKASNFNSFQYPPNRCQFTIDDSSPKKRFYSHVYLPGIGTMRYLDNREWSIPSDAEIRTVTVKKLADGWYVSILLNTSDILPELADIETVKSAVGIDLGIKSRY
jgi:putative transposase